MSNKLKLLAKSALAIPGMIATTQAAGPAESEVSYRYTVYNEDSSPKARDDLGISQDRYEIRVHQFHLLMPVSPKLAINVEGSFESMAGASPSYSYIPVGSDEVYSHFAGASAERRLDVSGGARYYYPEAEAGGSAYLSWERDYIALSAGVDGSIQLFDQMTTLSGGISFGYDLMSPTTFLDPGSNLQATWEPGRFAAEGADKWQLSVFEGLGQIIDMNTVVQGSVSLTFKKGYLSDPYRECITGGLTPPVVHCDSRPSTRAMGTFALGARKYLPKRNSVVHADYRFYLDSWNVASHTFDVDYYQTWTPNWNLFNDTNVTIKVIPGIRYYQQKSAGFYDIPDLNDAPIDQYYADDDIDYYSSDPRLSWYGAVGLKTRIKIDVGSFAWVGAVERYVANPVYGFNFDEEIPGLAAFWRFTTGLDFKF